MDRESGTSQSLLALLDQLDHGDELARCEAAKALTQRDDEECVSALIARLQAAEDEDVRKWSAYALGLIGDARAKAPLMAALRNRQAGLDVRCHAAEALGHLLERIGPYRDAVTALREVVFDEEPEIRFWVAFALGNIGSSEDVPVLERLAAMDDRSVNGWWSVSEEAMRAIEQIRVRAPSSRRS